MIFLRIKILLILLFFIIPSFLSAQNKTVFAHYVSWYQSRFDPAHSGWGATWSMDGHNPDEIDYLYGTLKRDISAKNYPLQGPYDSRDFKVLEYQILLAQASGIKGFVVDYFGTNNSLSYPSYKITREGFEKLGTNVGYLNKLNNYSVYSDFKICIAYDEQALNPYSSSYATYASNDLQYIKNNYAKNSYYYTNKNTGKPFLMVWQNVEKLNYTEWSNLLVKFTNFFVINFKEKPPGFTMNSHYPWVQDNSWLPSYAPNPYLWGDSYLTDFYLTMATNSEVRFRSGGVWPGFDDTFSSTNNRIMDRQSGLVYQNTWGKINPTTIDFVQIITWNDWTEGTEIEPSVEHKYKYIKETRSQINSYLGETLNDDLAFLVPQYIYNARLAVKRSIPGANVIDITNAIKDFYQGNYYSALTNATKGMGNQIPTIISSDRGNGTITFTWNKVPVAKGYKLYYGSISNYYNIINDFSVTNILGNTVTNFIIQNRDNSRTYYCSVSSYVEEKEYEPRYLIEGWVSPLVKLPGDSIAPSSIQNFKVENVNGKILLSWTTPNDSDYHSTYITMLSAGKYPQTPFEGVKIIHVTNAPGTYGEYSYEDRTVGYKYFSAFAMDKVENYSTPVFGVIYTIDSAVKVVGNYIQPSKGNNFAMIYIDSSEANKKVELKIYNLKGKIIKDLGSKTLQQGRNIYYWPTSEGELKDIPSGVYILSVTGYIEQKQKIVVVK